MQCKNCNISLINESHYCNFCGAKVISNRLTLKNLFQDFSESYLNYDNTFLRTFISLFTKPEDVIGSYIDGVRKKYANVVSYFALAITLSGLYIVILNKFFPEAMDFSTIVSPGQEEFQRKNLSYVQEYQSIFMMLYVPVYAIMCRLSFIGLNKYNYTELLVVFMYIQAHLSIVSAILGIFLSVFGITQGEMSLFLIPPMIIFTAFCLKRLYNLNFQTIILRTIIFLVILGIVFIILSIMMAIVMYLNGDLQSIIEAQKK
ncbi:DUF3667 domain-containing protein [Confluentibacter sediminis]|uniref:DUF3667 domain-containing protein n=1 Tax=Confluentibacter sediminis TaxID=2219045 RepID=UPI000DAC427D|nr:DUF3667 domain-containing protein [Confluentibacter sediminis]